MGSNSSNSIDRNDYAQTLTRLLLITDPLRLSHAIWYGRPFMATLTAADALMPKDSYPNSLLAQLAHHIPSMLLSLFESSIAMWKARCTKLIHPPVPLPLVRINASALRRLRSRQGYHRPTTSQTQTSQTSSLSSLPTPTHSQVSLAPRSTTPLFSPSVGLNIDLSERS